MPGRPRWSFLTLRLEPENLVTVAQQRNWALLALGRIQRLKRELIKAGRPTNSYPSPSRRFFEDPSKALRGPPASLCIRQLAKDPEERRAYQLLVASYRAQSQLHSAVERLKAYAVQHPKSAGLQYLLGTCCSKRETRRKPSKCLPPPRHSGPESNAG